MKKIIFLIALKLSIIEGFSQSCLPDGIDFTNQSQIDNFQADYPGCTEIEGDVEISGSGITNLNGLSVLTQIGGHLYISNNGSLDDLSGLSSLSFIGSSLLISNNPLLSNLNGINSLGVVEGDVFISNNPVLSDITALGGILPLLVSALRITGNPALSVCASPFICGFLANPTGKVIIYNNGAGCNNPPEIASQCGITLSCLPFGEYYFFSQDEINAFPGNYPGCIDLKGTFHIEGTDITSLEPLFNIHSLDGTLEIHDNTSLPTLEGLNSLVAVDGAISIVRNDLLTDISSLWQLDTGLISFLVISTNPLLSDCDIQSVCAYLAGPFGYSHNNITTNNSGCMDKDEVLQECSVNVEEFIFKENTLIITPNPASDKITIRSESPSPQSQISILNTNGQELFKQTVTGPVTEIDISCLPPGIYFVRLEGEKKLCNGRFVRLD
ncbi:MAG TPA: T9SS type A sorting domain-containing protein [Bacteroidales bacterium]|nr:T9SS type A sorting domain-containing protein [Bacteroidales bacterium]HNQ83314.1 T9SS type A sorting domain-containing protein [Bacteroidales bacterium]HOX76585.1 T9SS type A sorting domain-containing protein [Bacteroidales bacterium]HPI85999.1 T9SS type A sorting domain-containing protein [Bacteroidales bacterium]HPM91703.1 T9SS type A sorting domain-containing protein [Bacteroidales bacterium]